MRTVYGFDDDEVVTGDGLVSVESGVEGVEKVTGSRSFVRDPRLTAPGFDKPIRGIYVAPHQMCQLAPGMKWCYVCGDVRPKSYFSPDKRTHDGLDARCKGCEAERRRKRYENAVGHEVRTYTRKEAVAV